MFKKKKKKVNLFNSNNEWADIPIEPLKEFENIKLDRCEHCQYSPMCHVQRLLVVRLEMCGDSACPFYKYIDVEKNKTYAEVLADGETITKLRNNIKL